MVVNDIWLVSLCSPIMHIRYVCVLCVSVVYFINVCNVYTKILTWYMPCKRVPKFNNNNNNNIAAIEIWFLSSRFAWQNVCFVSDVCSLDECGAWQQHIPHINKCHANTTNKREMWNVQPCIAVGHFFPCNTHTHTHTHIWFQPQSKYIHPKSNRNHKFGGSFCVWLAPLTFVSISSRFIYIFRFHTIQIENFPKFSYSFFFLYTHFFGNQFVPNLTPGMEITC